MRFWKRLPWSTPATEAVERNLRGAQITPPDRFELRLQALTSAQQHLCVLPAFTA